MIRKQVATPVKKFRKGDFDPAAMAGWKVLSLTELKAAGWKPVAAPRKPRFQPAPAPRVNAWSAGKARAAALAEQQSWKQDLASYEAEILRWENERAEALKKEESIPPKYANGRQTPRPKVNKTAPKKQSYEKIYRETLKSFKIKTTAFVGPREESQVGPITAVGHKTTGYIRTTPVSMLNVANFDNVAFATSSSRDWSNASRSSSGLENLLFLQGSSSRFTKRDQMLGSRLAKKQLGSRTHYALLAREKTKQQHLKADLATSLFQLGDDLTAYGKPSIILSLHDLLSKDVDGRYVSYILVEALLKRGINILLCDVPISSQRPFLDAIREALNSATLLQEKSVVKTVTKGVCEENKQVKIFSNLLKNRPLRLFNNRYSCVKEESTIKNVSEVSPGEREKIGNKLTIYELVNKTRTMVRLSWETKDLLALKRNKRIRDAAEKDLSEYLARKEQLETNNTSLAVLRKALKEMGPRPNNKIVKDFKTVKKEHSLIRLNILNSMEVIRRKVERDCGFYRIIKNSTVTNASPTMVRKTGILQKKCVKGNERACFAKNKFSCLQEEVEATFKTTSFNSVFTPHLVKITRKETDEEVLEHFKALADAERRQMPSHFLPQHMGFTGEEIAVDICSIVGDKLAHVTNKIWVNYNGRIYSYRVKTDSLPFIGKSIGGYHSRSNCRYFTSSNYIPSGTPIYNSFGQICSIITAVNNGRYYVSSSYNKISRSPCKGPACSWCHLSASNHHCSDDLEGVERTFWDDWEDDDKGKLFKLKHLSQHNYLNCYDPEISGLCAEVAKIAFKYWLASVSADRKLALVCGIFSFIRVEKLAADLLKLLFKHVHQNMAGVRRGGLLWKNTFQQVTAVAGVAASMAMTYGASTALLSVYSVTIPFLLRNVVSDYLDSRHVPYDDCYYEVPSYHLPFLGNLFDQLADITISGRFVDRSLISLDPLDDRPFLKRLAYRFTDYFRFHSYVSTTLDPRIKVRDVLWFSTPIASTDKSTATWRISVSKDKTHNHLLSVKSEKDFIRCLVKFFEAYDPDEERIVELCDDQWQTLGYLDSCGLRPAHFGIHFKDTPVVGVDLVGSAVENMWYPNCSNLNVNTLCDAHSYDSLTKVDCVLTIHELNTYVITTQDLISGSPIVCEGKKIGIVTYSNTFKDTTGNYYVYPVYCVEPRVFNITGKTLPPQMECYPIEEILKDHTDLSKLIELPRMPRRLGGTVAAVNENQRRKLENILFSELKNRIEYFFEKPCHGDTTGTYDMDLIIQYTTDNLFQGDETVDLLSVYDVGSHTICPNIDPCLICRETLQQIKMCKKTKSVDASIRGVNIDDILSKRAFISTMPNLDYCLGFFTPVESVLKPGVSRFTRIANVVSMLEKHQPGDVVANYKSELNNNYRAWVFTMRDHWNTINFAYPIVNSDMKHCLPSSFCKTVFTIGSEIINGINILVSEGEIIRGSDEYLCLNISKLENKVVDVYVELRNRCAFLLTHGWPSIGVIDETESLDFVKFTNACVFPEWYFGTHNIHLVTHKTYPDWVFTNITQSVDPRTEIVPKELRADGAIFCNVGVYNINTQESLSEWNSLSTSEWFEANVTVPTNARECPKKLIDNPDQVPSFMNENKVATYTLTCGLSTGSGFSSASSFVTSHHVTRGNNVLMWASKAKDFESITSQVEYTMQPVQKSVVGDFDQYNCPIEFQRPKIGHIYAAVNSSQDFVTWFLCTSANKAVEGRRSCKFDVYVPINIDWKQNKVSIASWRRNPGLSGSPLVGANNDIVGIYGLGRTSIQEQIPDGHYHTSTPTLKTNINLSPVPPAENDIQSYFKAAALEFLNYDVKAKGQYCHLVAATGTGKSTLLPIEVMRQLSATRQLGTKICLLQPMVSAVDGCYARIIFNLNKGGSHWKGQFKVTKTIGQFNRQGQDTYSSEGQGSIELVISTYGRFMHDIKLADTVMHHYQYIMLDEIHTAATDDDVASVDVLKHHTTTNKCKYLLLTATSIGGISPYPLLAGKELSVCRHDISEDFIEEATEKHEDKHFLWLDLVKARVNVKTKPFIKIPMKYIDAGRTLIFVPSRNDCDRMCAQLRKDYPLLAADVFSLHAGSKRGLINELTDNAIVFCTDYASVSITVNNCRTVVDFQMDYAPTKICHQTPTGFVYNHNLTKGYVTKQVAKQRKGRTGRTCPGIYLKPKGALLLEATLDRPETYASIFFNMMIKVTNPHMIPYKLNHTARTKAICSSDWLLPGNLCDHLQSVWGEFLAMTTPIGDYLNGYVSCFDSRLKHVKRWDKDQLFCYLAPFISQTWSDATCDPGKADLHGTAHTDPDVASKLVRHWYVLPMETDVETWNNRLGITCYSFKEDIRDLKMIAEAAAQLGVKQTVEELRKSYCKYRGIRDTIEIPEDMEQLDNAYIGATIAATSLGLFISSILTLADRKLWRRVTACHYIDREDLSAGVKNIDERVQEINAKGTNVDKNLVRRIFSHLKNWIVNSWEWLQEKLSSLLSFFKRSQSTKPEEHKDCAQATILGFLNTCEAWFLQYGIAMNVAAFTGVWGSISGFTYNNLCSKIGPMLTWIMTIMIQTGITYVTLTGGVITGLVTIVTYLINVVTCQSKSLIGRPNFNMRTMTLTTGLAAATWLGNSLSTILASAPALHYQHVTMPAAIQSVVNPQISGVSSTASGIIIVKMIYNLVRGGKIDGTMKWAQGGTLAYHLFTTNPITSMTAVAVGSSLAVFRTFLKDSQWWRNCMLTLNVKNEKALRLLNLDEEGMRQGDASFDILIENSLAIAGILANPLSIISVISNIIADVIRYHLRGVPEDSWTLGGVFQENFVQASGIPAVFGIALAISKVAIELHTDDSDKSENLDNMPLFIGSGILANVVAFVYYIRKVLSDYWYEDNCQSFFKQVPQALSSLWDGIKRVLRYIWECIRTAGRKVCDVVSDGVSYVADKTWRRVKNKYNPETVTILGSITAATIYARAKEEDSSLFQRLRVSKSDWRVILKNLKTVTASPLEQNMRLSLKARTRGTPYAAISNLIASHEDYGSYNYGTVPSNMLRLFTLGDNGEYLTTSYSKPTKGFTLLKRIVSKMPYALLCLPPTVLCHALSAIGQAELYEKTGGVLFDLRIDAASNIDLRLMINNEFTHTSGILTLELINYDLLTKLPSTRWGHVEYFYHCEADGSLTGCLVGHGAAGNLWPSVLSKVLNNISVFKAMSIMDFVKPEQDSHTFFRKWVQGCNVSKEDVLDFMSTYEVLRFEAKSWWGSIVSKATGAAYAAADMLVLSKALDGFNRKFNIISNRKKAESIKDLISYKSFYECEISYMRQESVSYPTDYFCLPDKVISCWEEVDMQYFKAYTANLPESNYYEFSGVSLDFTFYKPGNVSCLNPVFFHPEESIDIRIELGNQTVIMQLLEYAGYYAGFTPVLIYQMDDLCVEPKINVTPGECGCTMIFCINMRGEKMGFHIISCGKGQKCSSSLEETMWNPNRFAEPTITFGRFEWDHCSAKLWEAVMPSKAYEVSTSFVIKKLGMLRNMLDGIKEECNTDFAFIHPVSTETTIEKPLKPIFQGEQQLTPRRNSICTIISDTDEFYDTFSFVPWLTSSFNTELEGLQTSYFGGHNDSTIVIKPKVKQTLSGIDKMWKFLSVEQGFIETSQRPARFCLSRQYQELIKDKYQGMTVDELYDMSSEGDKVVKKEISDYLKITSTANFTSRNPWISGFSTNQVKKGQDDLWLSDGNMSLYKPSPVEEKRVIEQIINYNKFVTKLKKETWENYRYTNRMVLPWQQPKEGEGQIYASRAALKAQLLFEHDPSFFLDCTNFLEPCCGFGGFAQFFSHQFSSMSPRNYYVSTLTHKTAATPNWNLMNSKESNCRVTRVLEHLADGNICNPKVVNGCLDFMNTNTVDCVLFDIGETFNNPDKEQEWWTAQRKFSDKPNAERTSILNGMKKILSGLRKGGKAVIKINTFNWRIRDIIHHLTEHFRRIRGHKLPVTPQGSREFYLYCNNYDPDWRCSLSRATYFVKCYAEELQSSVSIGQNIYQCEGKGYPIPITHSWFVPNTSGCYYRTLPTRSYGVGGGNDGNKSTDFGDLPPGHELNFSVDGKEGQWVINNSWDPDWHKRFRAMKQYVHAINKEAAQNRFDLGKQQDLKSRSVHFSDEVTSEFKNVRAVGSFKCKSPKTRLKNTHNMLISSYLAEVTGMNVQNCTYGHTQATPEFVKPSLLRRLDVDPGQPRPKNVHDFAKCVDYLLSDAGRSLLGKSRFLTKDEVLSAMNKQGSTGILDPGHNMLDFCETFPNWYEYIIEKIFAKYANGESTHMYFSVRTKPEPKERKDAEGGRLQHHPKTVTLEDLEKGKNLSPRFIQFADCLSRLSHYVAFGHLLSNHGRTKLYKGSINGTPPHIQGRVIRSYYDLHNKPSRRVIHLGNNPNLDLDLSPRPGSSISHEQGLNQEQIRGDNEIGAEDLLPSALTIDFSALDSTVTTSERMIMCENWKRFFSSDFEKKVIDGICREMNYAICLNDEGNIWVRAGQRGSGELLTSIENTYLVAANIACSISHALGIPIEELLKTEGDLTILTNGHQFNQLGCTYNVKNSLSNFKLDHKKFEFTKICFLIDGDDVLIITNRRRNRILLNYFNSKDNWLTQNCKSIRSGNKAGATMHLAFEDFSFCSHTYEPVFVGENAAKHVPQTGTITDGIGFECERILRTAQENDFKIFFLPKRPTANILSKLMVTLKVKTLKWVPEDTKPGGCVDLTQSKVISYLLLYPQIRWVRFAGLSLLSVTGDHAATFAELKKRYPDFLGCSDQRLDRISKFLSALESLYGVSSLDHISLRSYRTDANEITILDYNSKLTGHRCARTKGFFLKRSFEWIHSQQKYDVLPLTWDSSVWKKYTEFNDDPSLLGQSQLPTFVRTSLLSSAPRISSIVRWLNSLF